MSYNNKYAEYGIALSFACFVNGWTEAGGFKKDFDITTCAIGVVSAGLGKQVPFVFKYVKKYSSYSVSKLKTGLAKLNITGQQADEIIEKIKNSTDNILFFKEGEALSVYINKQGKSFNCVVESVRPGTNGKYVVMGRSMDPVKKVADDLKVLVGNDNVRILDDAYLGGQKFKLNDYDYTLPSGKKVSYKAGYKIYDKNNNVKYTLKGNDEWTVDMAWNDMVNNPVYDDIKDANGYINNIDDLKNLPMYKLNKQWIEKMKNEGYEVINIGNPTSEPTQSLFFDMEKSIMDF
ncbi:MAG: hypothetical protein HC905_28520 [Bacteroidales bacterium]|nr:hypothetical protein [Bacteroidales bacterium]